MGPAAATRFRTQFGVGSLFWRGDLLVALELPGVSRPAGCEQRSLAVKGDAAAMRLAGAVESYFAGGKPRIVFEALPLDLARLTDFEYDVYLTLAATPYGTLTSYAALARDAGHPGAARAVGNAMAKNPWPVLVPCHRVIRSDGRPGGFSCGPGWKHRLLQLEGCGSRELGLPRFQLIG